MALPVLCVNVDGSPRPNYPIDTVDQGLPKEGYRGWLEGHMATTSPVVGPMPRRTPGPAPARTVSVPPEGSIFTTLGLTTTKVAGI